jgi:hypothetical protein
VVNQFDPADGTADLDGGVTSAVYGTSTYTYTFVDQVSVANVSPTFAGGGWITGTVNVTNGLASIQAEVWGPASGSPPAMPKTCIAVPPATAAHVSTPTTTSTSTTQALATSATTVLAGG